MKCRVKSCDEEMTELPDEPGTFVCTVCGSGLKIEDPESSNGDDDDSICLDPNAMMERMKWLTYGLFLQAGAVAMLAWVLME